MIYQVCAILDKKTGAYGMPQFFRSRGEALRAFMDACAEDKSMLKRHAEDFVFCWLGEYSDGSGSFVCPVSPEVTMSALDAITVEGTWQ
ncbi:MAG: nonstructural protein [Microviridae sp.]|nr:MAG: nonstructural protein [Microviridae sp.]